MGFLIRVFYICSFAVVMTVSLVIGLTMDSSWTYHANFIIRIGIFLGAFLTLHLIIFNLSSLIRAIYYKIIGYSLFPLVLYPFCINNDNNSLKVKFTIRTSVLFYDFLPYGMENNNDIGCQLEIIKKGLYVKIYSRIAALTFAGILCIAFKVPLFILIVLAMFVEMIIFENINDRLYHGERIKIANIKAGKGIIYLLGLTDICDNLDDENTDSIIKMFSEDRNRNYILSGVKRNMVNSFTNKEKNLSELPINIIDSLFEKPRDISVNPDSKELDILILFIYYALATENIEYKNMAVYVLKGLQSEWGMHSKLWFNYFQWYIDFIKISMGKVTDLKAKEPNILLIKTDSIGAIPGSYYDRLRDIKNVIESIKEKYRCAVNKI